MPRSKGPKKKLTLKSIQALIDQLAALNGLEEKLLVFVFEELMHRIGRISRAMRTVVESEGRNEYLNNPYGTDLVDRLRLQYLGTLRDLAAAGSALLDSLNKGGEDAAYCERLEGLRNLLLANDERLKSAEETKRYDDALHAIECAGTNAMAAVDAASAARMQSTDKAPEPLLLYIGDTENTRKLFVDELLSQLAGHRRRKVLDILFRSGEADAGREKEQIREAAERRLSKADMAVFLASADLFAECHDEIALAIKRIVDEHFPVLLAYADHYAFLPDEELFKLCQREQRVVPQSKGDPKPLTTYSPRTKRAEMVALAIKKLIDEVPA